MKLGYLLIFFSTLLITGCNLPSGETNQSGPTVPADMDRETELKFTQYWTQGRMLYKKRCLNCHQNSGKGMQQLIPPLAGSDYLKNTEKAACAIRHGLKGEIVVNDTVFNGIMPANKDLTPIEIAELLTYVGNTWGNTVGFTTVKDAEKLLANCAEAE